jgi:GNAT superfamily N-acetyltransferase
VVIRQIDVFVDAQMKRFYAITHASGTYQREGMPFWSEREATVMVRHKEETEEWTLFGAFEGEGADAEMIGASFMMLPMLDNTQFAWIAVNVEPHRRCQGIGTALLEHVIDAARALGRTRMMGECNLAFADRDNHPYRQFAEKRGFALANVEVRRVLDLPVADGTLHAWIEDAASRHEDYRVETYIDDEMPDELIPSLVHVINQLALDAPTGDLDFEPEALTSDGFKARGEKIKEMGRTVIQTVAMAPDGDVVAYTTIGTSSDDVENVFQWGTLVRRDHRGHRLGMAVKARNLRVLQDKFPDRKRVVTTNSETNGPMVAINEEMGFKPVELLAEFQRVYDEN